MLNHYWSLWFYILRNLRMILFTFLYLFLWWNINIRLLFFSSSIHNIVFSRYLIFFYLDWWRFSYLWLFLFYYSYFWLLRAKRNNFFVFIVLNGSTLGDAFILNFSIKLVSRCNLFVFLTWFLSNTEIIPCRFHIPH